MNKCRSYKTYNFVIDPFNSYHFARLCGQLNENLLLIEKRLNIELRNRGNKFEILGESNNLPKIASLIEKLYIEATRKEVPKEVIHLHLQEYESNSKEKNNFLLSTQKKTIQPRGKNQQDYVKSILKNDINFGIGPAGTGKTFLAVACAADRLERGDINKIILVRPAVEAGEKLGFLPGDLSQKVDPYLRPLYDALYEMLGTEKVSKLIEQQIIEIAPLAYMRGRTLNNSFIILDESQNTTIEQMKMFLTRIGFGSTAIITGDITQIDLPRGTKSGLKHVMNILNDIEGITFTTFNVQDVVRHPLVKKIILAYEKYENKLKTDISI